MVQDNGFVLERDTVIKPYTEEIADYCSPFTCDDNDLDDFFAKDALYYDSELLGRTYAWIDLAEPINIIALVTLANDSIKTKLITKSARNRLQRSISNAQRGINYPAVLIGRLGVSSKYRGKGMNIGSQILDYIKGWFRSEDNKTGCRFIVVDAYNNTKTLHFYEKNGFKLLYRSAEEALRQITQKAYDLPFSTDGRKVVKIGVNFSTKQRRITDWLSE
ncbi:MAG: GNAT family N-acetyltransferase [Muribaculaceae bacterium]